MDIRCPSCKTLYEFNEARLKRGPVNLKCSQCGHVFRVEGRKGADNAPSNRWMLCKASGDVLYFQGLPTLQKWIVDRKVTREDQISKTGKKWKGLGTIGELSSFFQVADNIESLERVKEPEPAVVPISAPPSADSSGPSKTPLPEPPETDYFDPLAPGSPADDSSPGPASSDWAMNQNAPSSDDWIIDRSSNSQDSGDSPVAISLDMSAELAPPKPLEPRRTPSGTYDDPLEERRKDEGSLAPLLIVLILLLVLFLVAFAYLYRPHWLGLAPAPGYGPSKPVASKPLADAGTADKGSGATADAGLALADTGEAKSDAQTIAAKTPDASEKGAEKGNEKKDEKKDDEKKAEKKDEKKDDEKKGNDKKVAKKNEGGGFDGSMRRAKQHLNAGRPADALREYGRASDARPNNMAALTGKARAYLAMGRPDAAINIYKQALRMSPGNGLALMGIADAYRKSGQTQQAIDAYKKLLARQPKGPTADRARRNIERLGGTAPPAPDNKPPDP